MNLRHLIKETIREILSERAFDDKDEKRITDIINKADGDDSKAIKLAQNMASKIADGAKALRRAEAATDQNYHDIAKVFYDRAEQLGASSEEDVPVNIDKSNHYKWSAIKGKIYLPTNSAIALWEGEILGQMSDGM